LSPEYVIMCIRVCIGYQAYANSNPAGNDSSK
jgi:hypothetical protein